MIRTPPQLRLNLPAWSQLPEMRQPLHRSWPHVPRLSNRRLSNCLREHRPLADPRRDRRPRKGRGPCGQRAVGLLKQSRLSELFYFSLYVSVRKQWALLLPDDADSLLEPSDPWPTMSLARDWRCLDRWRRLY